MYLTTKSLYQTYLSPLPASELIQVFQTIDRLLQQYGPYQLAHPELLNILKKHLPLVFTVVTLLIQYKKCNKKTVKMLKRLIQTQAELEYSHFVITSPSEKINIQLEKELKKQFQKSDFSSSLTSDIKLLIKGGELSYERSLERDLKKIFISPLRSW